LNANVINLFDDDENQALVACKECGSDKWLLVCDPKTDPPVFTHIWCATDDCDTGCEIELREIEIKP
jgi:hypothetical protein